MAKYKSQTVREKSGKLYLDMSKFDRQTAIRELRIIGKRAQSRVTTLKKSGVDNSITRIYGNFNIQTVGKTLNQIKGKLRQAISILNNPYSTLTGIQSIKKKQFETLYRNYAHLSKYTTDELELIVRIAGYLEDSYIQMQEDSGQAMLNAEDIISKGISSLDAAIDYIKNRGVDRWAITPIDNASREGISDEERDSII